MCYFPTPNLNYNGLAYKKGVHEFDCGSCPECLQKRSSVWALRSVYEARAHVSNLMVTLTYDQFKYNSRGQCCGELPVNPNLEVNKRHIQLFIKRLRKWLSFRSDEKIKYIACAEYGSTTHRAHYHLILFGVSFPDITFYKKSKRGNPIYMSATLTKLWGYGICTIDCKNVHSAVARYCTKYCAKSRSDKTFTLCSQGIGIEELLKDFDGRSYFIDGREYPIPRAVWQQYITRKYYKSSKIFSYKYVNHIPEYRQDFSCIDEKYNKAYNLRKMYRFFRDKDPYYVRYLDYWRKKGKLFERLKLPVLQRINLLPSSKYMKYKEAALMCLSRRNRFVPFVAPLSNCVSYYERWKNNFVPFVPRFGHLPFPSRPNRASDTVHLSICPFDKDFIGSFARLRYILLTNEQLSFII